MSDYLGNLIARTVSPVAVVRPQLPSIFEPSLTNRQPKSEFDLEQETFSESPPITHHAERPSPIPLPGELPTPPLGARTALSASSSDLTEGRADKAVRAPIAGTVRPTPQKPAQEDEDNLPAKKTRREPAIKPVTPEPHDDDLRESRLENTSRRSRREEAHTSDSQLSTPNSQPKSQSLLTPALTIKMIPAVQPMVRAVRALPQLPPTPPPPSPTINVTIGRVEIRAASPPAPQRARAKPAAVLSLEDYLRQRANGGNR